MIESSIAAPFLEQVILLAYPVGDVVLMGALLLIIYNYSDEQPTLAVFLLAGGILLAIFSDCVYGYQSLLGTYISGGLLDLGWISGNILIGLAGATQWADLRPANIAGRFLPGDAFRARLSWIKTYLPYIWLLGAVILLIARALTPLPMSYLSMALGVGAILVLVVVRQLIMLSENHQLNLQLKSQAGRLEGTNRDLNLEIAERLRIQEKLAFDVLHDHMTGLANRLLFLDRLGQVLQRSKRHPEPSSAVLFLDLDQFKVVNDSLGHSVGDQLLVLVAQRLRETLRSSDTVARFGGDEFAVLLDDLTDEGAAHMLAGKIQAEIARPFILNEREVFISASIGIATDTIKYDRAEDMLRDADLAMYQAKALGKARSETFRLELRDKAFSRMQMEDELRRGLENREFQLYYQPMASLQTDQVVGFEALLRWSHPTRGLLLPAEFLSVAEESSLILPIGSWVLGEACMQLKTWQDRHPGLQTVTVNVNISDREFSQSNLAEVVARALNTSGLSGKCLRLEITEHVLVDNFATANDVILALQNMGVQIQIDDFGTGYSALAYLQKFPINAIKIDRSFVNEMGTDLKSLGLVRAIISMGLELGMTTIAEGIETQEQLNQLKELECMFGQGYLLSRPLDAASAEEVLVKLGA
jgi:diguanylate cyclase (GGDEF)-like protein